MLCVGQTVPVESKERVLRMNRTSVGLMIGLCLMGIVLCLMWSDSEAQQARLTQAWQMITAMEEDAARAASDHAADLAEMEAQLSTLTTQQAALTMEREALLLENAQLRREIQGTPALP